MRVAAVLFALSALALGCASQPDLTPKSGIAVDAATIDYQGIKLAAGDRVRIKSRAGTFKPRDTGHTAEVSAGPGQTGIFLGAKKRDQPLYASEPLQLALVRFDPQVWKESTAAGAEVKLGEFEATLHVEYVEALTK